jgi:hypothetical protein
LSYKEVPPDTGTIEQIQKRTSKVPKGQQVPTTATPAPIEKESKSSGEIQMNSSTAASVLKLKEVIQGKSKNDRATLAQDSDQRRRLEKLNRQIELKRTELDRLRIEIERKKKRARSQFDTATEPSMTTVGRSNPLTTLTLPPKPPAVPIPKPSESHSSTAYLPTVISSLLQQSSILEAPVFKFTISDESASFNMNLLRKNNFDLESLFNKKNSVTSYGSEFKSAAELAPLLQRHPRWNELKRKLTKGAIFPTEEIDETVRLQDLIAMKERGNHKSAKKHEDHLAQAFIKEVEKGWNLILPEEEACNIPHLVPTGRTRFYRRLATYVDKPR